METKGAAKIANGGRAWRRKCGWVFRVSLKGVLEHLIPGWYKRQCIPDSTASKTTAKDERIGHMGQGHCSAVGMTHLEDS